MELQRTTVSPASLQVSEEVHVSVEEGGGGGGGDEAKQQHADLESGLVDACSRPRVNPPTITQTAAPSFFKLLKKSCKSRNIFLLFISAVLSIGFGIIEKGIGTGWVEGAILMDAAITLVFLSAMLEFVSRNTQHQARTPDHAQLMAEIDKVCTCIQMTGLVFYIAILAIFFLHYMLERKDSNSGLPEIKGKATASTEIINVIENFCGSKSNMLAKLVLLLPAVVEKLPFSVALAIGHWRKKILPSEKANIAQQMSAPCTMDGDKATRSSEKARDRKCGDFERCIYYTIQKYIQPEITMNIALPLITLIAVCMGLSTITTIQSFWVEMVVTLPTGFALLMEPPTEEQPPPVRRTKGLNISNPMWRNILIQVAYQTAMLVTLQLKGKTFLGINQKVSESMVFNAFVLCQVLNQINARHPEKKNVFRGIFLRPWFVVSLVVALTLQLSFIEIAHILVGNARLNLEEWVVCLLIGMASWPIDLAGKCASDVIKKVRDSYLSRSTTTSLIKSPASDSTSSLECPSLME